MPEGLRITERDEDPYAWALAQAARLRRGSAGLKGVDRAGLSEFLEEWAEETLSGARSQLVNLMAHMAKVARSRNPAGPRLAAKVVALAQQGHPRRATPSHLMK